MADSLDNRLFEDAPIPLLVVDGVSLAVIRANARARDLLGDEAAHTVGKPLEDLFAAPQREAVVSFVRDESGAAEGHVEAVLAGSSRTAVCVTRSRQASGGADVLLALVPAADTPRVDPATGLLDRRAILTALGQPLQSRRAEACVAFIDVDRFRGVVERVGHMGADIVLREIAARIAGVVADAGVVARFGADEYVVLLWSAPSDAAVRRAAEEIVRAVREPIDVGPHRLEVSVCIGAARLDDTGPDGEDALKRAERAMRVAKRRGRGQVALYGPDLAQEAELSAEIRAGLEAALQRDELVLHYQPVVDVQARRVVGAEALVRWERPGQGLVMPGMFIPVAEESGLIAEVGAWVIQDACRQLCEWERKGVGGFWISVNVSAHQLGSGEVVGQFEAALRATGVDPVRCVFEVTETAVMQDPEAAAEVLETIRGIGSLVALDDFGTGYSSLRRLKDLPFSKLKIDRSFLMGMETHARDAALVAAIVALAHSFESAAVAEGVETLDQLSYLKALKCDMAQGFLFSRPVPPEAFERFLVHGTALMPE